MSATDSSLQNSSLLNLFRFLAAFAQSQQCLTRHLQQYPLLNCQIKWSQLQQISSEYLQLNQEPDSDYLVHISLPPQYPCPAPPPLIKDWISANWQDWRQTEVTYIEQQSHQSLVLQKTNIEQFNDNPQRLLLWQQWTHERGQWQQIQQRHQVVRDIFAQLQTIYTELQKQSGSLELVLGCAVLQDGQSRYQHPLLTKPVQLQFNALKNCLVIEDSSEISELNLPLLSEISQHANLVAQTWREQTQQLHPLDETARLQSQVMQDWLQNQDNDSLLSVDYAPVFFVRPRNSGVAQVADSIIKKLSNDNIEAIPLYLKRLAGLVSGQENLYPVNAQHASDSDILFALPSNQEQYQLAQQLQQHDIVLVQGPPGTGKTHTIANLIGHLLANKQRVLITSHNSKALRVLRDKVPAAIRSLCVSVLNDDKKSKQELAEAVAALNDKMAQASQLHIQAQQSREQRHALQQQQQLLLTQQQLCVSSEYSPIIVAGTAIAPSEAARLVYAGIGQHDWLPAFSSTERGKACPLSNTEIKSLYASQALISLDAEQEMALGLPALSSLPTPQQWQHTLENLHHYQQIAQQTSLQLWSQLSTVQISRLSDSLNQLEHLQQQLQHLTQHGLWLTQIIEAGLEIQPNLAVWQELFVLIEQSYQLHQQSQSLLLDYQPFLSAELINDPQTLHTLQQILAYLQTGGRFNWWKMLLNPTWKTLLEIARCNEQPISQQVHIEALIAYFNLEQQQLRLARRWQRQIESLGGVSLPAQNACKAAKDWLIHLQSAWTWARQDWPQFIAAHLEPLGKTWAQLEAYIAPQTDSSTPRLQRVHLLLLARVKPEWQAHLARHSVEQVAITISYQQQQLQPFLSERAPHSVLYQLLHALQQHDAELYQQAYQQLQGLHALWEDYQQRLRLLQQLQTGAQAWAQAIQLRQALHHQHTPPHEDINSAWQWRQCYDELQHRQQLDLDSINRQLQQCQQDLQQTTANLISQQTWAHQAIAAEPYRPHLVGWQQTQTRIGKGTGKLAPELRLKAQQQLKLAQYAVPVWIMPLAEVFRSFDIDSQFDVVIVDEASQVDIKGLLATYLGKKVVIVGDDEQVSPDAVGADSEFARRLQHQYLSDIPNSHLYDGQTSLYDLTKQVARGQLCLREHFRCVPAIIGFSNQLSYQGQIKALREPASSHLLTHVVPYRVQGERSAGKTNVQEAQAIVHLVQAMCQHSAYQEKTIGVISLLGNEQSTLIESLLRQALSLSEIEQRRLLCGNSAQFQGDERDVILLSMVDSNEGEGVMRLRSDGARDMNKKRYNVAASRAKDQLWVVHSIDYQTELKPDDLRRQLLAYCHEQANTTAINNTEHQTESPFEAAVLKQLLARGYRVKTQYAVGYYRIDMVVQGQNARLAIECDGDRYHSGSEKIAEDLARQAILERLGWQFYRIRGSAFFSNPQQALTGLWQRLAELDIQPQATPTKTTDTLLHQEIIRLAQNLATQSNNESENLPNHSRINELFKQRSLQRQQEQST